MCFHYKANYRNYRGLLIKYKLIEESLTKPYEVVIIDTEGYSFGRETPTELYIVVKINYEGFEYQRDIYISINDENSDNYVDFYNRVSYKDTQKRWDARKLINKINKAVEGKQFKTVNKRKL